MSVEILKGKVNDSTLWYAKDLNDKSKWLHPLSSAHQDEIINALQFAKENASTIETMTREDFPLPQLSGVLARLGHKLETRVGISVLRGIPLQNMSVDEIELLYAGITSHIGKMINQDTKGTLVGHVLDQGVSYDNIEVRGYTTNAQLTPHCDSGDLLGLLCVRPAREGGVNNFSCSMAIYNKLYEMHPEFLMPLYRGFHYNIRGNGPMGHYRDITNHRVPVFSFHQGRLSCRYNQKAILTAEQLDNSTPLSCLEKMAINYVAELAMDDDIRFDTYLEAGDLALINNNTVLHNRGSFIDYDEADMKRLMMRQWINLPRARDLTFDFADHYNTGPRMGPAIH